VFHDEYSEYMDILFIWGCKREAETPLRRSRSAPAHFLTAEAWIPDRRSRLE
jgi:hypothetical protein